MTALLLVNSHRLSLFSDEREATTTAAAFADDHGVKLGREALGHCRLYPRQSHLTFLEQLSGAPLAVSSPHASSDSDLIYLTLKQLASEASIEGAPVLAAVPGTANQEQLGLLLGIATEAGITLSGFIDRAVLDCAHRRLPEKTAHIDLALGGLLVSTLTNDGEIKRSDAASLAELGFVSCIDRCVNAIAERFVDTNRFDPLKIAATEQQIFDQVLAWLEQPSAQSLAIEISNDGQQRRLDTDVSFLLDGLSRRYEGLTEKLAGAATVVVTEAAAGLPKLLDFLRGIGKTVVTATNTDARANVARHADSLTAGASVIFTSRLPAELESTGAETSTANDAGAMEATHVLSGASAYPLHRDAPVQVDDVSYQIRPNGVLAVSRGGQALACNGNSGASLTGLTAGATVTGATADGAQRNHVLIQVLS